MHVSRLSSTTELLRHLAIQDMPEDKDLIDEAVNGIIEILESEGQYARKITKIAGGASPEMMSMMFMRTEYHIGVTPAIAEAIKDVIQLWWILAATAAIPGATVLTTKGAVIGASVKALWLNVKRVRMKEGHFCIYRGLVSYRVERGDWPSTDELQAYLNFRCSGKLECKYYRDQTEGPKEPCGPSLDQLGAALKFLSGEKVITQFSEYKWCPVI